MAENNLVAEVGSHTAPEVASVAKMTDTAIRMRILPEQRWNGWTQGDIVSVPNLKIGGLLEDSGMAEMVAADTPLSKRPEKAWQGPRPGDEAVAEAGALKESNEALKAQMADMQKAIAALQAKK